MWEPGALRRGCVLWRRRSTGALNCLVHALLCGLTLLRYAALSEALSY
jgi:hypothetical protein